MSLSENEADVSMHRFMPPPPSRRPIRHSPNRHIPLSKQPEPSPGPPGFPVGLSWPILLAIAPALGAFLGGTAEIWSDFITILLILYYVYSWVTVPWTYYEGARSRRMIHENAVHSSTNPTESDRRAAIADELHRHEILGLIWVLVSPAIAGYTLQYSRYFLHHYERYINSFNVAVFVLAASIKPLSHVMNLLKERTVYLQSEIQVTESHVDALQKKLNIMEEELYGLRRAFVTKKDLGQVTKEINPTIHQLAKSIRRFERKESAMRQWSEECFESINSKVREFDDFICYRIEQDQRSSHGIFVSLVLLPLNIIFWVAKRMTGIFPIPRSLLSYPKKTTCPPSPTHQLYHWQRVGNEKSKVPIGPLPAPIQFLPAAVSTANPLEADTQTRKDLGQPVAA
ncbi:hypothetical protein CLU79DRAFT_752816 [Phycomyces nitens]|nr:hypothetical protein CLU79DRAFT_752816 [Phycomyces nitens]